MSLRDRQFVKIHTSALDRSANTELEDSWIISHSTVSVDVWVDALDEVGDRARDDGSGFHSLLVDLEEINPP